MGARAEEGRRGGGGGKKEKTAVKVEEAIRPTVSSDKAREELMKRNLVAGNREKDEKMVAKAREWMESGVAVSGTVVLERKSGYVVRIGQVAAFLPTSQVSRERTRMQSELTGEVLKLVVTISEMVMGRPRIIVSERAAMAKGAMQDVALGLRVCGIVTGLADYGAFVALKDEKGKLNGAEGLVHISEITFDAIKHPSERLLLGDEVEVKIISIDTETNKMGLSMKQLERDPLTETIDSALEDAKENNYDNIPEIEGFVDICNALMEKEGVQGISPGRRHTERHTVSQGLEIYLTTETVDDGFNIVARSGRTVQEAHVSTSLRREEMVELLLSVSQLQAEEEESNQNLNEDAADASSSFLNEEDIFSG